MNEVGRKYPGLERVVFSAAEIAARVRQLGREIDDYYPPESNLLVVGLLKGAFVFVGDLVRTIGRPSVQVDFLIAALYGDGTDQGREVRLLHDPETAIEGWDVVLVEDIVDSGKTLSRIGELMKRKSPRSLEVCALLHKRRASDLRFEPRWTGFDAPHDWLVGYGLDLGERYRHLPFVAAIDPQAERGQ